MQYSTGKHCVFYHRYHLVWSTKYRFKVLQGDIQLRVRDICRQVCAQNGVDIIHGVLSSNHVHMFVSVPPKLAISDLMRLMKGRSSHKVQREFPALKKRY
jgi:putative transposase